MKVLKDTEDEKPPPLPPKTHVRIIMLLSLVQTNMVSFSKCQKVD